MLSTGLRLRKHLVGVLDLPEEQILVPNDVSSTGSNDLVFLVEQHAHAVPGGICWVSRQTRLFACKLSPERPNLARHVPELHQLLYQGNFLVACIMYQNHRF